MKRMGRFVTMVGLFVAFLALSVARAEAQSLSTINFDGSVTLPLEAHWGEMTLPAGEYTLRYGDLNHFDFVEVRDTAGGSLHGVISVQARDYVSATKNSLICIRDGNALVVRKLEMPAIGESVSFAMPHGTKLLAHSQKHTEYALAKLPVMIQRVLVQMNGK